MLKEVYDIYQRLSGIFGQYHSPLSKRATCLSSSVFAHQEKMPLAVVGSNVVVEVNGKKVRGRQYPWGVAEGKLIRSQWNIFDDVLDEFQSNQVAHFLSETD